MKAMCFLLALVCAGAAQARRSEAVFVLSGMQASSPEFFRAAQRYHAARIDPRQDLLVTSARSLEEVREWLDRSPLRGGQPWGRLTLIAHGSPWRGALLPLWRDQNEEVATATAMRDAVASGEFPPLGDAVVDARTELVVDSCGLGRRPDLLTLYAELLGGADEQHPHPSASREWIEYGAMERSATSVQSWRRERPFVAAVEAGAAMSAARQQALRAALHAQLVQVENGVDEEVWRLAPVRIDVVLDERSLCGRHRQAQSLTRLLDVREVLDDHALTARDLAWTLRTDAQGQCVLAGTAQIAVLGVDMPVIDAVSSQSVSRHAAP
jgi:hypothetical protein